MITRTRIRYGFYMLCGLGIVLSSISGLSSYTRTPMFPTVTIASGLYLVTLGAYGYLNPEKTNSPQIARLGAAVGFLLVFVLVLFLLHYYGITGIFSTGQSTNSFGYTALLFVMSVLMALSTFTFRPKEPKN